MKSVISAVVGALIIWCAPTATAVRSATCTWIADRSGDASVVVTDGVAPVPPGTYSERGLDLLGAEVSDRGGNLIVRVHLDEASIPTVGAYGRAYGVLLWVGEFRYQIQVRAPLGASEIDAHVGLAAGGPASVGDQHLPVPASFDTPARALHVAVPLRLFTSLSGERVGVGTSIHSGRLISSRFVRLTYPVIGARAADGSFSDADEAQPSSNYQIGGRKCDARPSTEPSAAVAQSHARARDLSS